MLRFSARPFKIAAAVFALLVILALLGAFAFPEPARAQAKKPYAFTILGPDGVVARVITTETACPEITIDGTTAAMQLRAASDTDFPITVCDAAVPASATGVVVLGQALKLPKAQLERVVVLGDTGCRLKGDTVQGCNDPTQWPFAPLAESAAKTNPDAVIHVGDYHYRESPCIVDKADCAGSPYGDNWASWDADFFTPARPLLETAPWVFVVGNHEDCARAGLGFFRMLDPRPMFATCPQFTEPYALNYVDPQLIVIDDSAIDDYNVEPSQVAEFQRQMGVVNTLATSNSWLLIHDPFYGFGHAGEKDGKETLFTTQATLQEATKNAFPASAQLLVGGHIHLFQTLSFGAGQPPQLLVGNGGTLLDPAVTTPLTGLEIAGLKVEYGSTLDKFGFTVMERGGSKWALSIKNVSGGDMDKCVLGGGELLCGQAALPVGGIELYGSWLVALALVGAAIAIMGLAFGVRGAMLARSNS